ncbi:MAG: hypothetical protein ACK45F_04390, partial [bacterium]
DKQTLESPSPLEEPAELELDRALDRAEPRVGELVRSRAYPQALAQLGGLQPHVARLFDEVLVNDPDPQLRARRHALLGRVVNLFWKVAHLEYLVVTREP